jgi:hypothetical protein
MNDAFSGARTCGNVLLGALVLRILDSLVGFVLPFMIGRSAGVVVLRSFFSVQQTIQILLLLTIVVLHIVFVRAYFVALRATGRATRWSPNFTIAAWFIPFGNFALPFVAVKQVFDALRRPIALPIAWWVAYIFMTINNAASFNIPYVHILLALTTFSLWAAMTKSMIDASNAPPAPAFASHAPGAPPPMNVQLPPEWGWVWVHHAAANLKVLGYYYRDKMAGPSLKIVVDLKAVPPEHVAAAANAAGYSGNATFRLGAHETINAEHLPPDFAAMMRQKYESGVGTAGPQCAVVLKLTTQERASLGLPPAPPHMEAYA